MSRQLRRVQSIPLLSAKNSQKSTQIYDYEISIETSKLMRENLLRSVERKTKIYCNWNKLHRTSRSLFVT